MMITPNADFYKFTGSFRSPEIEYPGLICYNMLMARQRNDRYGINIKKWCREHENYVEDAMQKAATDEDAECLLKLHEKKLTWLMHERLIHLIVLFITVVLALFAMGLLLFLPETLPASLPLFVIVFILLIFYVRHYFFLENTVQRWYIIDEKIRSRK